MASLRGAVGFLKEVASEVSKDDCTSMSAAIAYYTLFSLPPLLVTIIAVVGVWLGDDIVQEALTGQVRDLVGADGAQQIQTMIQSAQDFGEGSLTGKIVGLVALLLGATGAFAQLQSSLNRAWDVAPAPGRSAVLAFLMKRVLSFGMVLTIGFLLLVSLALSAVISGLGEQISALLGGDIGSFLLQTINFGVSLMVFTLLFAAIFAILPDAKVAWRDVWVGAGVTALLFSLGKTAIGLYLGNSDVGSAFGAAGSLVVILVWIYYTALILLVGAEFTQVWARHRGAQIQPDDHAVRVVREERPVDPEDAGEVQARNGDEDATPQGARPVTEGEVRHPYVQGRDPQPRSGLNE